MNHLAHSLNLFFMFSFVPLITYCVGWAFVGTKIGESISGTTSSRGEVLTTLAFIER